MACVASFDTQLVRPFGTPPSHADTHSECELAYSCCAFVVHTPRVACVRLRVAQSSEIATGWRAWHRSTHSWCVHSALLRAMQTHTVSASSHTRAALSSYT